MGIKQSKQRIVTTMPGHQQIKKANRVIETDNVQIYSLDKDS